MKLDVPTRNLESYFLSVVERARAASVATSGATASPSVAPHLRGAEPAAPETSGPSVLERLIATSPSPPSSSPSSLAPESRSSGAQPIPPAAAGGASIPEESRVNEALKALVNPEDPK
ncbi:MAG: hypothetical protein AB7O66_05155 [Limisphaerales bacterium]